MVGMDGRADPFLTRHKATHAYELMYAHKHTVPCSWILCRGPAGFMDLGSNIVCMSEMELVSGTQIAEPIHCLLDMLKFKIVDTNGRADWLWISRSSGLSASSGSSALSTNTFFL